MLQSPGTQIKDYQEVDYGLGANYVDKLLEFPEIDKRERTPFDLYKYGGKGKSSFTERGLGMHWEEWMVFHKEQEPKLMADVKKYMNGRYNFSKQILVSNRLLTQGYNKGKLQIEWEILMLYLILRQRLSSVRCIN